jgi:hypothetical protein
LRSNETLVDIRLVRPASGGVLEQVLPVDLNDPSTNYTLKPGDRLVVSRSQEAGNDRGAGHECEEMTD